MSTPQPTILPDTPSSAIFLVLKATDRARGAAQCLRDAAATAALAGPVASVDRAARLTYTIAFGPELWDAVIPRRPRGLRPFPTIESQGLRAPATGGDLFVHILSQRHDLNFELARRIQRALRGRVEILEEVHGFRYLDSRDLTGFIDGTENPAGAERAPAALLGKEEPEFEGGSFVFAQRYVHDLERWESTPVETQESAIGRRKRDSEELPGPPPASHVGRVVIEEGGEELQILRHSFPYGTLREAGLYFMAYTRDLAIPERMLRRMLGAAGDGVHDHLMDFTRAVSGATFFAPSVELLAKLAGGG
jgi:putative iron-dependent peroxidase